MTILFWFFHCTWGIITTFIGSIGALVMLIKGIKPKHYGYSVYFATGHNWGGVCLGPFFFVSEDCNNINTKTHEAGHSLFQALFLGPFFPFLVGIPSMIRYYLFKSKTKEQREDFCSLIICMPITITVLGIIITFAYKLFVLWCICVIIMAYLLCLYIWLYNIEIDRISDNPDYNYYSIWFERDASNLGMKHYKKNKNILKYE